MLFIFLYSLQNCENVSDPLGIQNSANGTLSPLSPVTTGVLNPVISSSTPGTLYPNQNSVIPVCISHSLPSSGSSNVSASSQGVILPSANNQFSSSGSEVPGVKRRASDDPSALPLAKKFILA